MFNNRKTFALSLLIILMFLSACAPADVTIPGDSSELPHSNSVYGTGEEAEILPERRIVVKGDGFIDGESGAAFVPRGVNHIEITRYSDCALANGIFEPARIDEIFGQLADYGYNTVRMFLDTCKSP